MALTLIILFLASALAGVTYYFGGYHNSIFWIWLPFVLALAYFWAIFLVYACALGIVSTIVKHGDKQERLPNRFAMWILAETCYVLSLFFRISVHGNGLGKLPDKNTPFMLVSNHLSGMDHGYLFSRIPGYKIICVSKKDNEKSPFAGGWIKLAGYLPIDQNDMVGGAKVIEKAASYIANGTCSVAIAPEGTRNKTFPDPELLPFKAGAFDMAYKSHCPIVVFAIQNTNCVLKRFPLRHTDVYFDCVARLEYDEYKDLTPAELAERCRALIMRRFDQKRARFYHVKPKKSQKEER